MTDKDRNLGSLPENRKWETSIGWMPAEGDKIQPNLMRWCSLSEKYAAAIQESAAAPPTPRPK
jgi:hypothetical protein